MKPSTRDVLRRAAEAAKASEADDAPREPTPDKARRREMDNAIFGVAKSTEKSERVGGIEI